MNDRRNLDERRPGRRFALLFSPLARNRARLAAAFLLPIALASLAVLFALRNESKSRRLVVEETYHSLSRLTSERLDREIAGQAEQLIASLNLAGTQSSDLIASVYRLERESGSDLRPLVLLDGSGQLIYPSHCGCHIESEIQPGQEPRPLDWFLDSAGPLDPGSLAAAVAGAEAAVDDGELEQAVTLLQQVSTLAPAYDPEMLPWNLWSRLKRIDLLRALRQEERLAIEGRSVVRFLSEHSTLLPENVLRETILFLRDAAGRALSASDAEPRFWQEALEPSPDSESVRLILQAASQMPLSELDRVPAAGAGRDRLFLRLADPREGVALLSKVDKSGPWLAVHLGPAAIRAWLESLLKPAPDHPWSESGIALADASGATFFRSHKRTPSLEEQLRTRSALEHFPGWWLVAYPPTDSIDSMALRELWRFAAILGLALGSVVWALILAGRSISRELALAQAREDFVAGVSHDLKTPLSLMRMYAENLLNGWVDEKKLDTYYKVILTESERLSHMLDNVLDFRQSEAGETRYRLRPLDLQDLVTETSQRYSESLQQSEIEWTYETSTAIVVADREAIERLLVNLISNAVKYIGEGQKNIHISLNTRSGWAVLQVEDSGIGMSLATRERAFEPFFRGTGEQVSSIGGSGIGLTLVQRIAEAHGGSVQVESAVGKGSCFAVSLPLLVSQTESMEIE